MLGHCVLKSYRSPLPTHCLPLSLFSSALISCVALGKYFHFSEMQCPPCQMEMILILMYYKYLPQFIVIHKVKGFGIVNKAEIDVFLELSCFFDDPADVGNLISCSSAFCKTSLNIWKLTVHMLLKPGLENFEHYFTSVWKILKEMGIPDHLTGLLRNLYPGQEATVRTGHGTTDWFRIGKGVHQGCILSPCLFNLYADYIMRNLDWKKHKLESRLLGEISINSDIQMTPPLWQKV